MNDCAFGLLYSGIDVRRSGGGSEKMWQRAVGSVGSLLGKGEGGSELQMS